MGLFVDFLHPSLCVLGLYHVLLLQGGDAELVLLEEFCRDFVIGLEVDHFPFVEVLGSAHGDGAGVGKGHVDVDVDQETSLLDHAVDEGGSCASQAVCFGRGFLAGLIAHLALGRCLSLRFITEFAN